MADVKVLHYVSSMNRAGQETLIMNVFRKIDRSIVMFDFLCTISDPADYDEEIHSLGGKINFIDYSGCSGLLKPLKKARLLYQWLKEHNSEYRVFHVHTQNAFYALLDAVSAKTAGIKKVIIHSHNSNTLYHVTAHKVAKAILQLMPINRFACSNEAGRWMFGNKSFQVIRNGIDTERFLFHPQIREEVRNEFNWNGQKIIGHVGRFNDQKNHLFLIKIFQKLHKIDPNTRLVLIGSGENEESVRQYIYQNNLKDCVDFLGVRDDAERLYQGMDLFLFPSKFEGLGIVVIEAQTAGLPCLISDVIPSDVDITNLVHRASLDQTPTEWAKIAKDILDSHYTRQDTSAEIRSAEYDVSETAQFLQHFFLQ